MDYKYRVVACDGWYLLRFDDGALGRPEPILAWGVSVSEDHDEHPILFPYPILLGGNPPDDAVCVLQDRFGTLWDTLGRRYENIGDALADCAGTERLQRTLKEQKLEAELHHAKRLVSTDRKRRREATQPPRNT